MLRPKDGKEWHVPETEKTTVSGAWWVRGRLVREVGCEHCYRRHAWEHCDPCQSREILGGRLLQGSGQEAIAVWTGIGRNREKELDLLDFKLREYS